MSPSAARAGRRLLWGSEPASAAWPVPGSCAGPRPPRKHWQRWHRPDALQEPAGRAGHGGRGERLEGREMVFKAQSKRGAAAGLSQGRKRPCPCPAPPQVSRRPRSSVGLPGCPGRGYRGSRPAVPSAPGSPGCGGRLQAALPLPVLTSGVARPALSSPGLPHLPLGDPWAWGGDGPFPVCGHRLSAAPRPRGRGREGKGGRSESKKNNQVRGPRSHVSTAPACWLCPGEAGSSGPARPRSGQACGSGPAGARSSGLCWLPVPALGLLLPVCLPPREVPGFNFQREFP